MAGGPGPRASRYHGVPGLERFRALVENSADGIVLLDSDGALLYVSPSASRIAGYSAEELMGRDAFSLVHPDDRAAVQGRFAAALERPGSIVHATFRIRRKDGSWRWLGSVVNNLLKEPGVRAVVCDCRDITERRQAEQLLRQAQLELERGVQERTAELVQANAILVEEISARGRMELALRESEAQLRLLLDSTAEGIYGVDRDGKCTFCNPAALQILGYSEAGQVLGQDLHALIHHTRPDGTPYPKEACPTYRACLKGTPVHVNAELFWRADGTSFLAEYRSHPVYRGGKIAGCVVTFLDVSERSHAEEALRKLSRAVEHAADSIFITDRNGVIEYVNPAFETLTGFTREEAVGRRPGILRSGVQDEAFYKRLWATILSGRVYRQVFQNERKDGTRFYEDETISPIADAAGNITHFVSVGRDLTGRIQMEERLRGSRRQLRNLAARLQSVREEERTRISREIHDELGQMLTALKIDLCWLVSALPPGAPALHDKIDAMAALVDSTIDSVGRIAAELRPAALDNLGLITAVQGLAREFRARTGVACRVTADSDDAELDPDLATTMFRICQEALTNVARHAEASQVAITIGRTATGLILTVEDNGKGIREEDISSAKSLGLLGMQERALKHGGKVVISGTPGRGTVVTVAVSLSADAGPRSTRRRSGPLARS
jgi:PAS domain S-box-containing protein